MNQDLKIKFEKAMLSFAIGDAIGVPYEGIQRKDTQTIKRVSMIASRFGQAGIWSDDTALTLCTMEVLATTWDIDQVGALFAKWMLSGYNSATGMSVGIGHTTRYAISNMHSKRPRNQWALKDERYNGNGALMRMLPVAFYLKQQNISYDQHFGFIKEIAEMTHGHIRSTLCCYFYVRFILRLIGDDNFQEAFEIAKENLAQMLLQYPNEREHFQRLLKDDFTNLKTDIIKSTGYVIDTIEAIIWLAEKYPSPKELLLQSIRLGGDTDTIAALALSINALLNNDSALIKKYKPKLKNVKLLEEKINLFLNNY